NRSSRNLLVRWATEADPDLGDAARAALALLGDDEAAVALRRKARPRGAAHLVDMMLTQVSPPRARFRPRAVTARDEPGDDDRFAVCATCGRRPGEANHLLAGGNGAICDRCTTDVARQRAALQTEDPDVNC